MFKYRYEKILSIKSDTEDENKLKLAKAIAHKDAVEKALQELISEYEDFIRNLYKRFEAGMSVAVHEFTQMNKRYYKEEIRALEYQLYKAQEMVEKARFELLESTKEKKKYEKLKERALNRYVAKIEEAQAQMIEEFVSNKVTNSKI